MNGNWLTPMFDQGFRQPTSAMTAATEKSTQNRLGHHGHAGRQPKDAEASAA